MSEYTPDKWAIIKISKPYGTFYKVLGSWYGGYLSQDSWRLNSGITGVHKNGKMYEISGNSGSLYKCREGVYGTTVFSLSALSSIASSRGLFELLSEEDATRYLEEQSELSNIRVG